MAESTSTAFLGVDTGGTFTDFVLIHRGELRTHKCLSTPAQPERAILTGIASLGLNHLISTGHLVVVHGSTVATNAALEGKGVRTVYITNRGFADTLSIGRQTRDALYHLQPPAKAPPVPVALCLETGGRLSADGAILEDLTAGDLDELNARIEELKPEAVAINLLFSFLDDRFEKQIADSLTQSLFISRSSVVLPEYKEYERGMATWLNAWLGPKVQSYLQRLQQALAGTPLSVMQSSGGTLDAENAGQRAVNLLLSGPAGGLAAAQRLGQTLRRPKLMTFDMGGTSTDVALIDNEIRLTSEGKIGPYPVAIPMVDMHTIGAGGGSIAYIDEGGLLRVGPESAGADPGPACYGNGGSRATVTDANVVLGRLPASTTLGGGMRLDIAAARSAVGDIARALNMDIEAAATGIIAIANEHMIRALRVISVQRGHDPKDFSLCCFGGAGGLHVCDLAAALGCREVIIPSNAGVFSALGMLLAPRERQLSRTLNMALKDADIEQLELALSDLADEGRGQLINEAVDENIITEKPSVDLCYIGQSYTLNLPWQQNTGALEDAFHAAHLQRYGHKLDLDIQLVNIRQAMRAPSNIAALPPWPDQADAHAVEQLPLAGVNQTVYRYQRETLGRGQIINGPALISEAVATSWLAPGWQAQVDEHGHLLLRSGSLQ